jgi:hypothetical protein
MPSVRHAALAALVGLMWSLSSCAAADDAENEAGAGNSGDAITAHEGLGPDSGTSDCGSAVRFQGVRYDEAAYSAQLAVQRLGLGVHSLCGDVGPHPRGTYFAARSPQLSVWSFPGYDPSRVVGVRHRGHALVGVYLARALSPSEEQALMRSLARMSEGRAHTDRTSRP